MKSYHQYCGLAISLDRIGDRWTLLIVRELLTGPKRFVDLLAGLPRVPTNLLAQRLRRMEADLLVKREAVPPPNPAELYVLTELGSGLQDSVLALVRWGGSWMKERSTNQAFRAHWLVVALRSMVDGRVAGSFVASVCVPEGSIGMSSNGESLSFTAIPPERPDCVVHAPVEVVLGVAAHFLTWDDAVRGGMSVEGNQQSIELVRSALTG